MKNEYAKLLMCPFQHSETTTIKCIAEKCMAWASNNTEKTEGYCELTRSPSPIRGTWPPNDIRRAFVSGAKWWEYHSTGGTMWHSDQRIAEEEAEKRYPNGKLAN